MDFQLEELTQTFATWWLARYVLPFAEKRNPKTGDEIEIVLALKYKNAFHCNAFAGYRGTVVDGGPTFVIHNGSSSLVCGRPESSPTLYQMGERFFKNYF